jgi:hypothetical protein
MKKIPISLLILFASIVVVRVVGNERPKEADAKEIMQQKLKHSQRVLEAIATNNFDSIAKNADELIVLSKEAEWKVFRTPRYEIYSDDFRRDAEALIQSAKEKNLDAAALAYVDLTLTCVKCHKYVREMRMTRREPKLDRAEGAKGGNAN